MPQHDWHFEHKVGEKMASRLQSDSFPDVGLEVLRTGQMPQQLDQATLAALIDFAGDLALVSRFDDAILVSSLVIPECERLLGADHEYTRIGKFNYSNWLVLYDRFDEALILASAVADSYAREFGEDSHATLSARVHQAALLERTGQLDAALEMT